jgi:hypothetical protein
MKPIGFEVIVCCFIGIEPRAREIVRPPLHLPRAQIPTAGAVEKLTVLPSFKLDPNAAHRDREDIEPALLSVPIDSDPKIEPSEYEADLHRESSLLISALIVFSLRMAASI